MTARPPATAAELFASLPPTEHPVRAALLAILRLGRSASLEEILPRRATQPMRSPRR